LKYVKNFLEALNSERGDIIVSNPPYVSEDEYVVLDPSVKDYEPKIALVAPNDGLFFYQEFAKHLSEILKPRGTLWLEISYNQGAKIKEIFKPVYVDILKDLGQHDRFAKIEY
jgi:release factor glutamine methyltransferase